MNSINNKYKDVGDESSIRTRPRKPIDFSLSGNFFPRDKQVLLLLTEVQELGAVVEKDILLQSFYKYLNDIVNLEIKLINSACNKLIYDNLVIDYTKEQKLNAWLVLIDEHYHVYVAQDMLHQLEQNCKLSNTMTLPVSDSALAVDVIKASLDENTMQFLKSLLVAIFENHSN